MTQDSDDALDALGRQLYDLPFAVPTYWDKFFIGVLLSWYFFTVCFYLPCGVASCFLVYTINEFGEQVSLAGQSNWYFRCGAYSPRCGTPRKYGMSVSEQAIKIAKRYVACFDPKYKDAASIEPHLLELLHSKYEHYIMPSNSLKRPVNKRQDMITYIPTIMEMFKSFDVTPRLAFADSTGRYVEIKASSKGETKTGAEYGQQYSLFFELAEEDGKHKIIKCEEMVDSLFSSQFFPAERARIAAAQGQSNSESS